MPFKMMFLPGVILLSISAAVSFKVPPGDSVGQEKMVLDSEHSEKPEGFNLADIIQGNNKMPGMGAWSSIFQRLASKKPIERETLQNMLQSVGGDLAEAYVDPGLYQDFENHTIQKQIQNITADKELQRLCKRIPWYNGGSESAACRADQKTRSFAEDLQRFSKAQSAQRISRGSPEGAAWSQDESTLQSILEMPKLPAESALVSFGQLFDSKNRDLFNFQLGGGISGSCCWWFGSGTQLEPTKTSWQRVVTTPFQGTTEGRLRVFWLCSGCEVLVSSTELSFNIAKPAQIRKAC
ncbi:unnamed protein product [Cladocopium goreaui]|uniref:Peptidylprolyl isomerase n=1 Tax=Cladocopium goreaui TaxID=2562237 RepID=A0A9P1G7N6_9DINO|nr:unnamed protein product [Cladocopium goreaui]